MLTSLCTGLEWYIAAHFGVLQNNVDSRGCISTIVTSREITAYAFQCNLKCLVVFRLKAVLTVNVVSNDY